MNIKNILKKNNDYFNEKDNNELIELLNFKREDNVNNLSENKINELKKKLEVKLLKLEKLYEEKFIILEKNIKSKLDFRESLLKKNKDEYIEFYKYYTECLNEIRFHQDLINLNETHSNLINELTDLNLKKKKLKNIKSLDRFYFECNNDIIFKNDKIFEDIKVYNDLKTNFTDYEDKIKREFDLKKKSYNKILIKLENSLKNLINQQNLEILEKEKEATKFKNKIKNTNINIQNKIHQLEVNNKFDNLKILQNDKYRIDIDLNNKRIILLDNKYKKEIKSIENIYLKKKNEIEDKIKYNKEKLFYEDKCHQEKIEKRKLLIKNYEKYYKNLESENEYLINKNKNIEKNINSINDYLKNLDIDYLRINNDIKNILKKRDILTAKLSKKYKYYLDIYEDDLYNKKIKIYEINESLNKIKKINVNDKDLIHIKNKIIIIKKFLEEN